MFFKTKSRRAKDLLSGAYKVYNFRRDAMPREAAEKMLSLIDELEELIDDGKISEARYGELEQELEALMRKHGGKIYPLTAVADYVDMVVVAGIIALGIRSFFLQPFKIPTNSMYPSFYGMTAEVYTDGDQAPNIGERIMRKIFKSASNYRIEAPCDGEAFIEINGPESGKARSIFAFDWVDSRDFFIIPSKSRQYTITVGGREQKITLPQEFQIDDVIMRAFPDGSDNPVEYMQNKLRAGDIVARDGRYFMRLGSFKKGRTILNFDLLGGDMLFVDRVTYNFRKPRPGEPFVFMTKYCDGLTRLNGGIPDDRYYIKRLVGAGGDTLKIDGSALIRNGEPSKGSPAFDANARKAGKYCGYVADGALANGAEVKVPEKSYWAMGDNSRNSLDSRYWGEVPQKAVVGKSLIIFYPFTDRWGMTK